MNRCITFVAGLFLAPCVTSQVCADLQITFNGPCPGPVTVEVTGAEPLTVLGLVYASCRGSYTIQSGGCAGTELGLCRLNLLQGCNGWVQVVDGATCAVSTVVRVL